MGLETGNGQFGFVLGLRERKAFGWREGKMKPKGKGWNRGEGSVGAVVGCLWGKWLRWRNGGARWWLTWEKKMGEWFVWLAAEKGECKGSEQGCWMEKRKASAGSRARKSKAGRAALFFIFSKGGSDQKRKMKRV
jgi:hypothetical protein